MSTARAQRHLLERLGASSTVLLALHLALSSVPAWADGEDAQGRAVLLVGAHALRALPEGDAAVAEVLASLAAGEVPGKADKLGYVLFQLAPWVTFSDEELARLEQLPNALPGMTIAVEFRNRSWFGPHTEATLKFLRQHDLAYVSIDGPRSRGAVPSLGRR